MTTQIIALQSPPTARMMGMRQSALPLRAQIEEALAESREVEVDFAGLDATQSFVDELVGVLVAKHGVGVMRRIVLKGCTPDVQAIVKFVVADRGRQRRPATH